MRHNHIFLTWPFPKVSPMTAVLFALLANICFGVGSLQFTYFSKAISVWWMNTLKVVVSTFGTIIVLTLLSQWRFPESTAWSLLSISGITGLAIGDFFLLQSFSVLGPGRTLVLFGMHPLIVGAYDYFFFKQKLPLTSTIGVALMICCLLIFMHERWNETGKWDLKSFALALFAVFLDGTGVLLSKLSFQIDAELTSWQANFWRSLAAAIFLIIWGLSKKQTLSMGFAKLSKQQSLKAIWASTYGTFLSLSFYFIALSMKGPLSTISAVTITGPIVASALECIHSRKKPTFHLMLSLAIFPVGLYFLAKK